MSVRAGYLLALMLSLAGAPVGAEVEFGGHVKARLLADGYPAESVFDPLTGSAAAGAETELRANLSLASGPWSLETAWQLFAGSGDRFELSRDLASTGLPGVGHLPNDDRRWVDLTGTIRDRNQVAALHRLDRLAVGYTGNNVVLRVGRQAITWGNGLVFSPMDIVNPFDPTAVDTEYKAGDDMFYGQYLRSNGDDFQFAYVLRRDPMTGELESSLATAALKYHGILGDGEYDLLVSNHYDDATISLGGNLSVAGAVLRGDAVWTDTAAGSRLQLVANLSYSWVWGGRNLSGVIEYYFTEFGQRSDRYDLASLSANTELVNRIERGEAFTLGRNYLAGGVTIELTPLWLVTPNLFTNLDDESALLQIVTRSSLSDNAEFLAALNLPLGPSGSEYGGIEATLPDEYLATDFSLFVQFAWYF